MKSVEYTTNALAQFLLFCYIGACMHACIQSQTHHRNNSVLALAWDNITKKVVEDNLKSVRGSTPIL